MPILSKTVWRGWCLVAWLSGAAAAAAQDQADHDPLDPPEAPWTIQLEASIWAPAIGGDIRLPGGAAEAEYERFDVDDPTVTPFGEIQFKHERLTISVSGFGFSFDRSADVDAAQSVGGLDFAAGAGGDVEVDFFSAQMTAGWRVWREPLGEEVGVTLSLDVYGGVRGYDFDTSFTTAGGMRASANDGWIEPIIGAKFSAEILRDFTFDVAIDVGALPLSDHSSASLDIIAGIQWRPWANVGFQFGWRQLLVDLSDGSGNDEFDYEGALAGLYGSVVLRF